MNTLDKLFFRYPTLETCRKEIESAHALLKTCFSGGHTLYLAGNGGSRADCDHIVGELMKGFLKKRPLDKKAQDSLKNADLLRGELLAARLQCGLPAIALGGAPALSSAFSNDVKDGDSLIFAQELSTYAKSGDVLWGVTTSGNSENILFAATVARAKNMKVLGLTGEDGGKLNALADVMIRVPGRETYRVQELHLPVYHCLCLMLEEDFFNE